MIYASLNAKKGNYQYPAAINTALEFLAKPETAELPVGRYELDGDNIFVLIQDQTTLMISTALIVQWMSLLISIRQLLRLRKVLLSNWNS